MKKLESEGIGKPSTYASIVETLKTREYVEVIEKKISSDISWVVRLIEESEARFVDLRFTDTKGKQHHFTIPARIVLDDPEEWFENGQAFDGSSIGGWKGIQASDMQLRPDPATALSFVNSICPHICLSTRQQMR